MSKNILELKRKGNEANSNAREECTGWGEKQTNVSKMNRDGKWIQSDSHQMGMSAVVWEVGDEKGRWVSNRLVRFEKRSKGKAVSGNLSSECFSSVIRYMGTDQFYNGTSECAFFFNAEHFGMEWHQDAGKLLDVIHPALVFFVYVEQALLKFYYILTLLVIVWQSSQEDYQLQNEFYNSSLWQPVCRVTMFFILRDSIFQLTAVLQ